MAAKHSATAQAMMMTSARPIFFWWLSLLVLRSEMEEILGGCFTVAL